MKYYKEGDNMLTLESPPARGAWIEIRQLRRYAERQAVAPRTGGVD